MQKKKILDYLTKNIKKFDLVIINDFGHGLLTEKLEILSKKKVNF